MPAASRRLTAASALAFSSAMEKIAFDLMASASALAAPSWEAEVLGHELRRRCLRRQLLEALLGTLVRQDVIDQESAKMGDRADRRVVFRTPLGVPTIGRLLFQPVSVSGDQGDISSHGDRILHLHTRSAIPRAVERLRRR